MQKIDHKRATIYIILAGFLPLFLVLFFYTQKMDEYNTLEEQLNAMVVEIETTHIKESTNKKIKELHKASDHFYLDKTLEKMSLLQKERQALEALSGSVFHPRKAEILQRLQQINDPKNKLLFAETNTRRHPDFLETEETLSQTVEVSMDDILSILDIITPTEKLITKNSPQLLVSQFSMERKALALEEIYLLNLKLIKREFKK